MIWSSFRWQASGFRLRVEGIFGDTILEFRVEGLGPCLGQYFQVESFKSSSGL